MSLLRIVLGGAAAPPNLPEFSVFQTISVAQLFVIMTSVVNAMGCCRLNCNSPRLILSVTVHGAGEQKNDIPLLESISKEHKNKADQ